MVYSVVMDIHLQFVYIYVSLHCERNISVKVLHVSTGQERVITVFSVIGNLKSGLGGRLLRLS